MTGKRCRSARGKGSGDKLQVHQVLPFVLGSCSSTARNAFTEQLAACEHNRCAARIPNRRLKASIACHNNLKLIDSAEFSRELVCPPRIWPAKLLCLLFFPSNWTHDSMTEGLVSDRTILHCTQNMATRKDYSIFEFSEQNALLMVVILHRKDKSTVFFL